MRNAVFYNRPAVGGCEGRRCETAVAAMLAYGRLCSPMVAYARLCSPIVRSVLHWEVPSQVVKRIVIVGCRWLRTVALCYWGMVVQVSMVARCYWDMSLQVAKRNSMVASRWCWVADGGGVL